MKIPIVIISFLFAGISCPDVHGIMVRDFLATAIHDYTLENQTEKIDFLHTATPNTPFFDRIELRTESDEFELSRQRYSLRFYPNGWSESANGKKVYEATVQCNEIQRDALLHQALKKRYTLVIDFLHSRNTLKLNRKLMALYEDRLNVLSQSSNSVDFDINDLIEAEDDSNRLQVKLIDLENRRSTIEDEIRVCIPEEVSIEFDTDSIAEIGLIKKTIRQLSATPDKDNVYFRNSRVRLELARCRYNLEKSRSSQYIRYFEANYDNEERHDTREAFSVELGIRLPFINSNRLDVNRRMLGYLTEKGRYEGLKRALSEKLTLLSGDLKRSIEQHELLMTNKERGTAESSIGTYMHLEGIDPLILLKIKESILKRDITLENTQYKIHTQYIEFLDAVGKLSEKPLRNYISSAQERVVP